MSSALHTTLEGLTERHGLAVVALGLEASRARLLEIEGNMGDPGFWNDQDRARKIAQEAAELKKEIEAWDAIKKGIADAHELVTMSEDGSSEDRAEAERVVVDLEKRFAAMEFHMLFSGAYDARGAVVSFHAGAGGTDANDWVAMLLRMISRFAERQGFSVEILDESRGEEEMCEVRRAIILFLSGVRRHVLPQFRQVPRAEHLPNQ